MDSFSIWHWLVIVFIVVAVFRYGRRGPATGSGNGANIVYSVTKNLAAAIHLGVLSPQKVLDRLDDKHRAKLPEIGVDTELLRAQAKLAKTRNRAFAAAQLLPTVWLLNSLSNYAYVDEGLLTELEFIGQLFQPLALSALIAFVKSLRIDSDIRNELLSQREGSSFDEWQNIVVFGGFMPFAGYGLDLDGWSFTLGTDIPRVEGDVPQAIGELELLDALSGTLHKNMSTASIADRLYVNGQKIRTDKRFLPDPLAAPVEVVASDLIKELVGSPDGVARHYRSLSVPLSEGQLHLTFFFRSTMLGSSLFIESRTFLLPPLRPELAPLVHLPSRRGFKYLMKLAITKLLLSPIIVWSGLLLLLELAGRVQSELASALFGDPEVKRKRREETYNYGHAKSLREESAAASYQSYFQLLDKDMTTKAYQHLIINKIVDFLESKGICTDDIKERRTQIFNSGVMVSGGVVNANQMAVGTGAKFANKVSSALGAAKSS
jgi:hypothetical protein